MVTVIITARTANSEHVYNITQLDSEEASECVNDIKDSINSSSKHGSGLITINDNTLGEVLLNPHAYHALIITIEKD